MAPTATAMAITASATATSTTTAATIPVTLPPGALVPSPTAHHAGRHRPPARGDGRGHGRPAAVRTG